jgi:hypothetical protein
VLKNVFHAAYDLRFAVGCVCPFTTLLAASCVFQPNVGVAEESVVIQAPSSLCRFATPPTTKRGASADEPRTVFTVDGAFGKSMDGMWVSCPLAIGDSITQWRTVTSIDVTRLVPLRLFGMAGVTTNTVAAFCPTITCRGRLDVLEVNQNCFRLWRRSIFPPNAARLRLRFAPLPADLSGLDDWRLWFPGHTSRLLRATEPDKHQEHGSGETQSKCCHDRQIAQRERADHRSDRKNRTFRNRFHINGGSSPLILTT